MLFIATAFRRCRIHVRNHALVAHRESRLVLHGQHEHSTVVLYLARSLTGRASIVQS